MATPRQLSAEYGVRAEPPGDRSWGMRDFTIAAPTGVLWRIAQNTEQKNGEFDRLLPLETS